MLNLEEEQVITKNKIGFHIDSYRVDRINKIIDIFISWKYSDDSISREKLRIEGDDFDVFYPIYTTDENLYEKVATLLNVEGTVDLTNEPN